MQTNKLNDRKLDTCVAPAPRALFHLPSSILHPQPSDVWAHRRGPILFESVPALRSPRAGFTMMELLTVVTIIAILMTLLIQVVGAFITQARDSATKATVEKNQGLINSRAQAFNRLIMRKGYVSGSVEYQWVKANYSNNPTSWNTLATKLLEEKFFPQNIQDLTNPVFLNQSTGPFQTLYAAYLAVFNGPNPPGQNLQNNLGNYSPALDQNHTLRSSEILYQFLTQSNVLGNAAIGPDAFTGAEVTDTPEIVDPATGKLVGNGLPELVDAWGNPLRFYRWPTRFFRSGGTGSAISAADVLNAKMLFSSLPVFSGNLINDLAHDPDDPLQNCVGITGFEQTFHTPATYHVHLIVSPGPDGQLGIYEPDDFTNYGYLAAPIPGQQDYLTDNIMYLNVRAGGK